MAASRIFYIPSLLVENSFVSPVSRDYQSVTLLELETPNTSTFNTIKAESFNVKWKPEERCDAKTTEQMLVIDTPKSSGTIFSLDVIQFPFLFSTHIDPQSISNEQNTEQGLFCFCDLFSVSINRSLCPDGAGSEASTCQACLLRSEASHYPRLERLNGELPANCDQIQTTNRDH